MPDLQTISAAFNGIKSAIDIVKTIQDTDGSLEKAKYKLKIVELINNLSEVNLAYFDLVELIKKKEEENEELRNKLNFSKKLILVNEAYFEINENGEPTGNPYCTNCWESSKSPIHLKTAKPSFMKECPSCGAKYHSGRVNSIKEP